MLNNAPPVLSPGGLFLSAAKHHAQSQELRQVRL